MKQIHFLFILLLSLCACTGRESLNSPEGDYTDSLMTFTPKHKMYYDDVVTNALKLEAITSPAYDFYFRAWLGHSMAIYSHILNIKMKDGIWKAEIIKYSSSYDDHPLSEGDNEDILNNEKFAPYKFLVSMDRNIIPKSGWDHLSKEIYSLISAFEQSDPSDGGGGGVDGIYYKFEIGKNNQRTELGYSDPSSYQTTLSSRVLGFSSMLEDEFRFEYIK